MKFTKPDTSNWSYNCKCNNCETQLEVEESDIRHSQSGSDGPHPSSDNYYVYCPVCAHGVNIPVINIPKIIQIESKKRSSCVWR